MSLAGIQVRSPSVRLQIIGGPASISADQLLKHLVSFKYIDVPKKLPKITFEFDNSDGTIFNFAVLLVGLKLKVSFGYENYYSRPFIVPIKTVEATTLREPGRRIHSPKPDVYGLVRMTGYVYNWPISFRPDEDVWESTSPMTLSQAVTQIARKYGYREKNIHVEKAIGQLGEKEPTFDKLSVLAGETVGEFIDRKAREQGFMFRHNDKEFHWHSEGYKLLTADSIEYFKGPDLLSFSIEGDYSVNLLRATAKGIDPKTGKVVTALFNSQASIGGAIMVQPLRSKTTPKLLQPTDIVTSVAKKAGTAAASRLLTHVANKWKLRLVVVGQPRWLSGLGVQLGNFGPVVDGLWHIREVEHVVDSSGYTTTALCSQRKRTGNSCAVVHAPLFNAAGLITGVAGVTQAICKKGKKGKNKKPRNSLQTKYRRAGRSRSI